jgi:hypothetical protein
VGRIVIVGQPVGRNPKIELVTLLDKSMPQPSADERIQKRGKNTRFVIMLLSSKAKKAVDQRLSLTLPIQEISASEQYM